MALELELKYSSPDGQVPALAELESALAQLGYSVTEPGLRRQTDTYYDDDAATLQLAGLALRVRQVERVDPDNGQLTQRMLATLKSRGNVLHGVHERDEYESELAPGEPLPWLDELVTRLPRLDLQQLTPRMLIVTDRHVFRIDRAGEAVAELVFDEVHCRPPQALLDGYSIDEIVFHEVELEALGGAADGAVLTAIGEALQELMPLNPSDISKLERATSLLAPFADE